MRYLTSLIVTISLCASGMGYADDTSVQQPDVAAQISGNNAFALELYAKLKNARGNLFFSPYSISSALAMTATGASGQTKNEMDKVLHLNSNVAAVSSSFSVLNSHLFPINKKKDQLPLLLLANGIWIQKGFAVQPAFVQNLVKNFQSSVTSADFEHNADKARQSINEWVAEKTLDKVINLFPVNSLDQNTRLVLASAIYMQAKWAFIFDKNSTAEAPFYLDKDNKFNVEMMNRTGFYPLLTNDQLAMVEIPYASESESDPRLKMVILLPHKSDGLAELEDALQINQLRGWMDIMESHNIHLTIPKFKIDFDMALKDTLKEMGMVLAFSDKADFKLINDAKNLSIDKVFHKAYIAVDEKGTEAAAASGVSIGLRSARILSEPYHFLADHPFLFLIMEGDSILFMGRVAKP